MSEKILNIYWSEATDEQWLDWRWQQRERITGLEQLEKVVNLTDDERQAVISTFDSFEMSITPYYASLMDIDDPMCPVRMQSIPVMAEGNIKSTDLRDPLGEEKDMPVKSITYRYKNSRVLFYTNHNCPVFCRHCTRKLKVSKPESMTRKDEIEVGLEYLRANKEIYDVVISGGDPLSLSDKRLHYILEELAKMENIQFCRLGTRNPVTLPQRINEDFCDMLKSINSRHLTIYCNTHFNHVKECTDEAWDACDKLSNVGVPIGNQMVLMKGLNDKPDQIVELNKKLVRMRVKPYYIYQADRSFGISHFATPISAGLDIIEKLRGHHSGLMVPTYVIDGPGGGGKIPMMNSYEVSRFTERPGHDGLWRVVQNYNRDELYYYPESPDDPGYPSNNGANDE